ncbi:MAG: hypothetical protein IKB47_00550 [Clostridia bacterium]|nr:hypothetical protein [Clostridia bacterium]
MKKIVCILLLLVICVMTVSCSGSEVKVPDGMKLASGSGELYYLFVPNAWTVKEGSSASAFVSASDMSNVSVVAYVLQNEVETEGGDEAAAQNPRAPYIDAFWSEFCADAGKTLIAFDVSDEVIDTQTLGGFYAKQFVYTHTTGGVEYKHRMAVTYYGEMIIYLLYSSTAENYDSHAADVDNIIKEFQFKQ